MKMLLRSLLVVAILLATAVLVSAGFAFYWNQAPEDGPEENVVFTVERGETVQAIADRLGKDHLIRSPLFLRALARIKSTEGAFQSGSYMIDGGASTVQVHNILVSGHEILQKVTIPEGRTISNIARSLEEAGITSAEEFVKASRDADLLAEVGIPADSAEGYLFPDTYLLPKMYPAKKVLAAMAGRFFDVLEEVYPQYTLLSPEELEKKIILASIIEREYVVEDEAPLMASVFYNRMAIGMPLQSCATVAYVLTEELGREHPEALTLRDLEVESAYNTYRNDGLPPGAISNPGRVAISAVFYPAHTDYLFFLLKDPQTGQHEFTRNYGAHLVAKNLYLKRR